MTTNLKILCCSLFICAFARAQTATRFDDEFDKFVYRSAMSKFDSINFTTDSIVVGVKYNSTAIMTTNSFTSSRRSIKIEYYFKNDSLKYVLTSENDSPNLNKTCFSHYYIANNKILDYERGSRVRGISPCVGYSKEEIIQWRTCVNQIDYVFLDKYIFSLLDKIKIKVANNSSLFH